MMLEDSGDSYLNFSQEDMAKQTQAEDVTATCDGTKHVEEK